jgi:uncharacterized SAM-binding protein YcdF (DUF218 family)
MSLIAEVVKSVLIPGSLAFLLLGLGVGVVLLYLGKWGARQGRRWLTALALLYAVLGLPAVSNSLIAGLRPEHMPLRAREDARGARVVAVLGNGVVGYADAERVIHQITRRTAFAVLEGVRVIELLAPDAVIVSGGIPEGSAQRVPESEVMRDELVALGVPASRIVLESASRNTGEQLANIARIVRERALTGPMVLVTTPAHSRRALMLADHEGLDIVPSMADELRYDSGQGSWHDWVPTIAALRGSESAIYEYMANLYENFRIRLPRPVLRQP